MFGFYKYMSNSSSCSANKSNPLQKGHYLLLVWVTDDITLATCTYQPIGDEISQEDRI